MRINGLKHRCSKSRVLHSFTLFSGSFTLASQLQYRYCETMQKRLQENSAKQSIYKRGQDFPSWCCISFAQFHINFQFHINLVEYRAISLGFRG